MNIRILFLSLLALSASNGLYGLDASPSPREDWLAQYHKISECFQTCVDESCAICQKLAESYKDKMAWDSFVNYTIPIVATLLSTAFCIRTCQRHKRYRNRHHDNEENRNINERVRHHHHPITRSHNLKLKK